MSEYRVGYCPECGKRTDHEDDVCMECGRLPLGREDGIDLDESRSAVKGTGFDSRHVHNSSVRRCR